ncbi:MAG: hypothetical protein IPM97_02960 [Bdellovibrionaceae bacterium]|nr:hypothetical protein [Pseudobdellovibrionaceae bacterium]
MKRRFSFLTFFMMFACSFVVQAKLNDTQAMKCIYQHRQTQVAFLDLEQAYEMRSVSAKDFFQAIDNAPNCSQLRKNLKKLHGTLISQLQVRQGKFSSDSTPPTPSAPEDNFDLFSE